MKIKINGNLFNKVSLNMLYYTPCADIKKPFEKRKELNLIYHEVKKLFLIQ
jgi:hypothetical protein